MPSGSLPIKCLNISLSKYSYTDTASSGKIVELKTWNVEYKQIFIATGSYSGKFRNYTTAYSAHMYIGRSGQASYNNIIYKLLDIDFGTDSSLTAHSITSTTGLPDEYDFLGSGISLYLEYGGYNAYGQISNLNMNLDIYYF